MPSGTKTVPGGLISRIRVADDPIQVGSCDGHGTVDLHSLIS